MAKAPKAKRVYRFEPDYAVPPGETLEEVLESMDMTRKELSIRTGLTEQSIIRILKGDQPITFETANKLEMVTGVSARFWNDLEMKYREQSSKIAQKEEWERGITWSKTIPMRELIERQAIPEVDTPSELVQEALRFYGVANVDAWERLWNDPKVAARRSDCFESLPGPASAWIRMGEIEVQDIPCDSYQKDFFKKNLQRIRGFTTENPSSFIPKMQGLCAEAGVALVFIPEMKKVPWNGATKWLSPKKAMIILNLRDTGEDLFWFSFFHEAGHVLTGKKQHLYIAEKHDDSPEEKKADRFASEILIPARYNKRIAMIRSKAEVLEVADSLEISPGIVAGRYRYLTERWECYNDLTKRFQLDTRRCLILE